MKTAFYVVDNQPLSRTIDAWDMIVSGAKSWRFALNEDQYANTNWTARVPHNTDYYAAQHAAELRKKHKKLRLWYSSGRDSNYILRTFIKNRIPLDELSFVNFNLLAGAKRTEGADDVIAAIQQAYTGSNQPVPKVTIHNVGAAQQLEQWKLVSKDRHTGGSGTATMSFNSAGYGVYAQLFYPDDLETCNIVGLEKPKLMVKGNRVFFYMVDLPVQHCMSPVYCFDWFFMSPDAPNLTHCQVQSLFQKSKVYANLHFGGDHAKAIAALQLEKTRYDDLCFALGLGPATSTISGFALGKTYGGFADPFYKPVLQVAEGDNWDALKFYNEYKSRVTETITKYATIDPVSFNGNFSRLPGIMTKLYYVGDLL